MAAHIIFSSENNRRIGATYLVIWLMLHRFRMIGGWTWPQIALLYSLDLFTYALGAAFTFSAMVELEDMVREGTVEGILVQPLNPYFHIVSRKYNVGYAAHVLLSGGVLLWALTHLDIHWTLGRVVYFLLILLSGVCMQAACLTFWVHVPLHLFAQACSSPYITD